LTIEKGSVDQPSGDRGYQLLCRPHVSEDIMNAEAEKISFLELARRVIENVGKPMTSGEIWQTAQRTGLVSLLNSTGKTPEESLAARLYTDVKKPSSLFLKLGSRPVKFLLKTLASSIPNLDQQVASQPAIQVKPTTYKERELHPLLVWFAEWHFGAHCRTIFHEKSLKKGEKQNQWIHPDVVGFALTTQDWTNEVVQLAQSTRTLAARLYSFEVKIALDFTTLREFFFQAVSNSSWAHEGYLVAVEIDDDPDFRAELTRLSQSFGIGVIQLNISNPDDCTVLLAPRKNSELDWQTVDRIAAVNPDFGGFISSVAKSVKINHLTVDGFDKILTDIELEVHLKKIQGN
jgi:hypothetical protein